MYPPLLLCNNFAFDIYIIGLHDDKSSSVQFFVLDKICDVLNCEIGDILYYENQIIYMYYLFVLPHYTLYIYHCNW